jgi:hypothetical protein
MSHSTDNQISDAAQRATDEIAKVCQCGGIAAIAMIVADHAESMAAAIKANGMDATADDIARTIYSPSVRIIHRMPATSIH